MSYANRLGKNLITPSWRYEEPILKSLVQSGGKVKLTQLYDMVYAKMADILNHYDLQSVPSTREPRWKNNTRVAGADLKNGGFLKPTYISGRSYYEITDLGISRVSRNAPPALEDKSTSPAPVSYDGGTLQTGPDPATEPPAVNHRATPRGPEAVQASPLTKMTSEEEFVEARQRLRFHKSKERNAKAVRRKKREVLNRTGKLLCEVCDHDFVHVYGELGKAFAECHHRTPLTELEEGHKTRLDDLAIVCANCHRMLHRSARRGKMLSVEELRSIVRHFRMQSLSQKLGHSLLPR